MNAELNKELVRLGVSAPERETQFLSEGAIVGVIKWTKDQNKRGHQPTSNAIVHKLRGGGLQGYGELSDGPQAWYRSYRGRERWLENHLPDTDPIHAETAIISLIAEKREPSIELVQRYAELAERQQEQHHEACRRSFGRGETADQREQGG